MVERNASVVLDYLSSNRGMLLAIAPSGDLESRDPEVAALADAAREAAIDQIIANHFGDSEAPPAARLVIRAFPGLVEAACTSGCSADAPSVPRSRCSWRRPSSR